MNRRIHTSHSFHKQFNLVHARGLSPSQSHCLSSPSPTPLSRLPYTRIRARSRLRHPTHRTSQPFRTFVRSTSHFGPSLTRIICRLAPFSPPNASSPQISRRKSKFRFTQSIIFFSSRVSRLSINSCGSAAIVPLSRPSRLQRILIHQRPNSLIAQLPPLLHIRMNRSGVSLRANVCNKKRDISSGNALYAINNGGNRRTSTRL